jgi:hypothetical protein
MDVADIYDAMIERDIVEAVVRYNGAGDEGYIEDVDYDPPVKNRAGETDAERDARAHALEPILRDAAYDILEARHPGWEINEGSEGTITFNAETRTTKLHHGDRIETTEWHDVVEV